VPVARAIVSKTRERERGSTTATKIRYKKKGKKNYTRNPTRYDMAKLIPLLLSIVLSASAYPDGAPRKSCADMFPHHKKAEARKSDSPFQTMPSQNTIGQDADLELELTSSNELSFAGFMTMAFDQSNDWGPIGTFKRPRNGQILSCSHGLPNAATHSDNHKKTTVKLVWTPPEGFQGSVVFKTTFVQSKKIFWVQVPSSVVHVTGVN